jgi:hypothetical protein
MENATDHPGDRPPHPPAPSRATRPRFWPNCPWIPPPYPHRPYPLASDRRNPPAARGAILLLRATAPEEDADRAALLDFLAGMGGGRARIN